VDITGRSWHSPRVPLSRSSIRSFSRATFISRDRLFFPFDDENGCWGTRQGKWRRHKGYTDRLQ
jgi:hypothetical protein